MNKLVEIETRNLMHEMTGIASVRQRLDLSKIPTDYDKLLNTNEPKLRKIIKFFKSNSETAELLLSYINHIENESEQSINNRDKSIIEIYKQLIEANKRIIELSPNKNERKEKDSANKKYNLEIINFVRENPKIWRKFYKQVDEYARMRVKGSKEKSSDYISREILNNTVSRKSVNDTLSRLYKKDSEKKRQSVAKQNNQ